LSNKKYTTEQQKFLEQYYSSCGPKFCAEKLSLTRSRITHLAKYLGIERSQSDLKSSYNFSVDPSVYESINEPVFIYFLGYFWADGWVHKSKNCLRIGLARSDGDNVKTLFTKFCRFKTYYKNPDVRQQGNCQWQLIFELYDKYFVQFLRDNDYCVKSLASPTKILSRIPKHFQHYFWRGYFDGDGCFAKAVYPKQITYTVKISGAYLQDWSDIKYLLDSLGIAYKIDRVKEKLGHSSVLFFHRKHYIKKFGEYLYQNYPEDGIGLLRKYLRWDEAVKSIKKEYQPKLSKYKNIGYSKKHNKWYYRIYLNKICYFKFGFTTEELALTALTSVKKLQPA